MVEKRGFFGGNKFVTTYMERDKKKIEKMDFCFCPPAHLIEIRIAGSGQRVADRGQEKLATLLRPTGYEGQANGHPPSPASVAKAMEARRLPSSSRLRRTSRRAGK